MNRAYQNYLYTSTLSTVSCFLLLETISYGKTTSDFKTENLELSSYPATTKFAVMSKDQIGGMEMWEAEVSFNLIFLVYSIVTRTA